jgi:hypothetical protein
LESTQPRYRAVSMTHVRLADGHRTNNNGNGNRHYGITSQQHTY